MGAGRPQGGVRPVQQCAGPFAHTVLSATGLSDSRDRVPCRGGQQVTGGGGGAGVGGAGGQGVNQGGSGNTATGAMHARAAATPSLELRHAILRRRRRRCGRWRRWRRRDRPPHDDGVSGSTERYQRGRRRPFADVRARTRMLRTLLGRHMDARCTRITHKSGDACDSSSPSLFSLGCSYVLARTSLRIERQVPMPRRQAAVWTEMLVCLCELAPKSERMSCTS